MINFMRVDAVQLTLEMQWGRLFNETVGSARIFLEFIKMVVVRIRYYYSQL